MSTKNERALAFEAGQHASSDPSALEHGVAACPFDPGTDEAGEWLRGFSDAVGSQIDPATLRKELTDAMKASSHAG